MASDRHIAELLLRHMAEGGEAEGKEEEDELVVWYLELVEDEIQDEAQLFELEAKVQLIIKELIDRDRVIVVETSERTVLLNTSSFNA